MAFLDEWKDKVNTTNGEDGDDINADDVNLLANGIKEALGKKVEIPENISQFKNDVGYITNADIPKKLSEFENDAGYITESAIPEKLSELENDKGFITDEDLPKKVSQLENDSGFATKDELVYDTIIHSQEEWDAMVATEDWNGAKNVLLRCNVTYVTNPDNNNHIPSNIHCINCNGFAFTFDGCTSSGSVGFQALGNFTHFMNGNITFIASDVVNINGFYNCHLSVEHYSSLLRCKNFIGCTYNFEKEEGMYTGSWMNRCSNIILDKPKEEYGLEHFIGCTNVIYEKTKLSEFENDADFVTQTYVDELVGDIDYVLDELHSYAQAKINGGEAE